MKTNIMNYINILHGYTTAIKNLHWSSGNMSEHKLCDDIADSIAENEDLIAEISQGVYGQIKKNELKPIKYEITSTSQMLSDLLKETESFYNTINDKKLIGLKSVIENFLGEINKFQYLIKLSLKEDMKKRLQNSINEEKYVTISHDELREMVQETLKIVSEDIYDNIYNKHDFNHFNNDDDRYESYVLIDNSDMSIIANYNNSSNWQALKDEAIQDANLEAQHNKFGSYSVYGCINNEYDEDTLVYMTENVKLQQTNNVKRLTESQFYTMITEAVNNILKETSIFTDDPYHNAEYNSDDIDFEDYGYDPEQAKKEWGEMGKMPKGYDDDWNSEFEKDPLGDEGDAIDHYRYLTLSKADVNNMGGSDSMKNAEKEYAWDEFDQRGIYPDVDTFGTVMKGGETKEKTKAFNRRKFDTEWTPSELDDAKSDKKMYLRRGKESLDNLY